MPAPTSVLSCCVIVEMSWLDTRSKYFLKSIDTLRPAPRVARPPPFCSKTAILALDHVFLGDAHDLVERRDAFERLPDAVVAQGAHPVLDRLALDDARVRVARDERTDVVVDQQELVDSRPAAVALV